MIELTLRTSVAVEAIHAITTEVPEMMIVAGAGTVPGPLHVPVRSAPATFSEAAAPAPEVDLGLTLTDAPDPVTVGDDIVYTLGVTNRSTNAATAVKPDLFVRNVSGNDITFKRAGTSSICTESYGAVSCDFGGVAAGATETATVVVTVHKVGEQVALANFFRTAEPDPNPGERLGRDHDPGQPGGGAPYVPKARLSFSKSAPARVVLGDDLAYRLTVQNQGPDVATGVTATDVLRGPRRTARTRQGR